MLVRLMGMGVINTLTHSTQGLRLNDMEFKVSELEKEPIEFDLAMAAGHINFGEEAEQDGNLQTSGLAEVIHEHRGPRDIIADIRLRGKFSGKFQVPCARCVE